MTEHQLEKIHNYTKFKVVELLIKKHQEGVTVKDINEIEDLSKVLIKYKKVHILSDDIYEHIHKV